MSQVLEGNPVRKAVYESLRPRIARLTRPPGLAVVLVGNDPASEVYVRNKIKACAELGIVSEKLTPAESVSTDELLAVVEGLNRRPEIDGILVQMPLPPQVSARQVLLAIAPEKDVDGFHPVNVGNLVADNPGPRPCTPAGVMRMLDHYGIELAGRRAVIVGRSNIVGKPMAMLLLHRHATVTICHSKTADLPGVCREADLLVAAIGRAAMITRDYIRPGAVVVDVGVNRVDDAAEAARLLDRAPEKLAAFRNKGSVLVGDVHPADAAAVASAYTPVPGGVGPLTIAMLMANTVELAECRLGVC